MNFSCKKTLLLKKNKETQWENKFSDWKNFSTPRKTS